MTITADWQGELGGTFLFGQGTSYRWRADGFSGFALPDYRTTDMPRGPQVPGVTTGQDVLDGRLITLPLLLNTTTATSTQQAFQTLKAAFKPATSDTYLDVRVPGLPETTMRAFGRPRGVSGERWEPHGRTVSCVALFLAADPFWYGALVTTSNSGTTVTVSNAGDATTRRATVAITPQAAAPTFSNAGDGGSVTFATTLTSGTATVLDLSAQTVSYSSASRADLVSPSSPWFTLAPGSNAITFTGASAVTVYHRPAYH